MKIAEAFGFEVHRLESGVLAYRKNNWIEGVLKPLQDGVLNQLRPRETIKRIGNEVIVTKDNGADANPPMFKKTITI